MAQNFRLVKYLSFMLRNHPLSFKDYRKYTWTVPILTSTSYSTALPKQVFDVFEIFTDLLDYNRNRIKMVKTDTIQRMSKKETDTHKIDKIIDSIDLSNLQISAKILAGELDASVKEKDWTTVEKIVKFCVDLKVPLSRTVLLGFADEFCNIGYVDGLRYLILMCDVSKSEDNIVRGELLHYLAKCHWITSNTRECVTVLQECLEKHPNLVNYTKSLLRMIIYQAVSSRSQAELQNIIKFVQCFTLKYCDYYPLVVLWNCLFVSEWHIDNKLADELIENDENLRACLEIMCPSLTRYFIKSHKLNDVYRLLQVLLKYKMMSPYSSVTQILFDHYCLKRDRGACSEIIRTSIILKAPLRDEQYNQFISWSVAGDPYKHVKPTEIERIYSKF